MLAAKLRTLTTVKRSTTRTSVATSLPINARSKKSRERSGRYSVRAVLAKLSASTSASRRQYGTMNRSARRRSASSIGVYRDHEDTKTRRQREEDLVFFVFSCPRGHGRFRYRPALLAMAAGDAGSTNSSVV